MKRKRFFATCLVSGAFVLGTPSAALAGLINVGPITAPVTVNSNDVTVDLTSNDCNVLVASNCDED